MEEITVDSSRFFWFPLTHVLLKPFLISCHPDRNPRFNAIRVEACESMPGQHSFWSDWLTDSKQKYQRRVFRAQEKSIECLPLI